MGFTLTEANYVILALIIVIAALVAFVCYVLHSHKKIRRRNEQMMRILTALDDYRALVADKCLTLDEQEALLNSLTQKSPKQQASLDDEKKNFFVKMDARVNREKPFTDPGFDQDGLIRFMGVTREQFCRLVPRYQDPGRTLDYINSLRAEYAAKILIDHADYSAEAMTHMCGFRSIADYNSIFKFAFGITPAEYVSSMGSLFKKKQQ